MRLGRRLGFFSGTQCPGSIDITTVFICEVVKETPREIKSTEWALDAPIDNLCLSTLSFAVDGDCLEAVVTTIKLEMIHRNNEITTAVSLSASTQTSVIEGEPDTVVSLF